MKKIFIMVDYLILVFLFVKSSTPQHRHMSIHLDLESNQEVAGHAVSNPARAGYIGNIFLI